MAGNGGCMSKANARQNGHNKKKYEAQKLKTERNKDKNIKAQKKFAEKKAAEKAKEISSRLQTKADKRALEI